MSKLTQLSLVGLGQVLKPWTPVLGLPSQGRVMNWEACNNLVTSSMLKLGYILFCCKLITFFDYPKKKKKVESVTWSKKMFEFTKEIVIDSV